MSSTEVAATSTAMAGVPQEDAANDKRAEKQLLRKEIRALLKVLPKEAIVEQSEMVWKKLVDLPVYQTANSVGLFLSMPKNEISTEAIIRRCVADGKNIYVPQVGENFENADMDLIKVVVTDQDDDSTDKEGSDDALFYESWPKNKWGIPEPPPEMPIEIAQPGDIDLLVVPGLAFDHKGERLGQGKGYYDRFIARMSVEPLKLVAVCLDCQLLSPSRTIPVQEYDRTMEMVVTPSEIIHLNAEQKTTAKDDDDANDDDTKEQEES